eukprot:TRINITY_DN18258_c0_g1_i1.p1 TRINITY_DN18258_c0_g1~~TRINITY_DN18258_c0_g1_i1.p1  ORF type:complete len:280 (-),score=38.95 TRINITY_DN18258_c0_g1_i1:186-1025(-)
MGARDFLFFDVSGDQPRLSQTVPAPTDTGSGDHPGLNGMVEVRGGVIVAVAMNGSLVTALANGTGVSSALSLEGHLASTYDLDVYEERDTGCLYAVVVSAKDTQGLVALVRITAATGGAVLPTESWAVVGVVPGTGWKGCNRVRVAGTTAFISCFGTNSVAAIDISHPSRPQVVWEQGFVDEQPTGMLLQGNALLVAGGRSLAVYNISDTQSPTLAATCTDACAQVLVSAGQNAHSFAIYREALSGEVFAFLSAQIDNSVGLVRVVSPVIRGLLFPSAR